MIRYLLLVFFVLMVPFYLIAQDDFKNKTDILPPSPNAAALGAYGGFSPNYINGSPAISLPLFSLKAENNSREIGLSLSYNSSGFKVDEMYTSTGHGWSLQGGGVISRVINDIPDERGQKVVMPQNMGTNKPQFNRFLQAALSGQEGKNTDAQPDQFNFNFMGYSGKFVFDHFMHAVPLDYTPLKIDYFSSSYIDSFKVTTPDGLQYFFTQVETSRSSTSCAQNGSAFQPTAWYLTRIKFNNHELARFTYKQIYLSYPLSESQTIYSNINDNTGCAGGSACPAYTQALCRNYFDHNTVLLTSITCNSGKININYIDKLPHPVSGTLMQLKGELVESVEIRSVSGEKKKSVVFAYQNIVTGISGSQEPRPFLRNIIERDNQDTEVRRHQFDYNELNEIPARLSFSQDHWGYFNGSPNSSLLPRPASFGEQQNFPSATANREPNDLFAKKGLLKKITYPTGGSESFEYEAHTAYIQKTIYPDRIAAPVFSQGTGLKTKVTTSTAFNIQMPQEVRLQVTVAALDPVDPYYTDYDPQHNIAYVTVTLNGNVLYQQAHNPGAYQLAILNPGIGNLLVTVESYGQVVKANALVEYIPGTSSSAYVNEKIGGVRVKRITSFSGSQSTDKYYYYAKLTALNQSSGIARINATYFRNVYARITCPNPSTSVICSKQAMFTNCIYNLFVYSGQIQYEYVTESIGGPNFENGGIQHKYTVEGDVRPYPLLGDDVGGVTYQNNSIYSGRELETLVFNAQLIPVSKTVREFGEDSTVQRDIEAYTVTQRTSLPPLNGGLWPNDDEIQSYNLTVNKILSRWIYQKAETVTSYDGAGNPVLSDRNEFLFENISHTAMTQKTHFESKGGKEITKLTYVADQVIVENKTPIKALLDFNAAIASCESTYNAAILSENTSLLPLVARQGQIWMNCYNLYQNNCSGAPCVILGCSSTSCWGWQDDKKAECRVDSGYNTVTAQINDILSNSTAETDRQNCINTAVTQYNNEVQNYYTALAQAIINASVDEEKAILVMQQRWMNKVLLRTVNYKNNLSTEISRTENKYRFWPNDIVNPRYVYTGFNGSSNILMQEFVNYDEFGNVIHFRNREGVDHGFIWSSDGVYPIAQTKHVNATDAFYSSFEDTDGNSTWGDGKSGHYSRIGGYSKTMTGISNGKYLLSYWSKSGTTWVFNTTPVTVNSGSYTISLSGQVDELRFLPAKGEMVSYTYEPLIGVTAQADVSSRFSFFEYDNFGRLILSRDGAGNIVNKYCYSYFGQPQNCGGFLSQAQTGSFTRNNCSAGGSGSSVSYTVAAGRFSSMSSQADANAQATAALAVEGQANANSNRTCTFYNDLRSGSFTRNNCSSGYAGSTVTYTIAASTISSTVSKEDANNLAVTAVNSGGQAYANSNGSCTAITVYARAEVSGVYNEGDYAYGTVMLKFYSNAACTVPYSVSNLTVSYQRVRTNCGGGGNVTANFSAVCNGSSTSLGLQTLTDDNGLHCWNYAFSVIAGTGYTPQ